MNIVILVTVVDYNIEIEPIGFFPLFHQAEECCNDIYKEMEIKDEDYDLWDVFIIQAEQMVDLEIN